MGGKKGDAKPAKKGGGRESPSKADPKKKNEKKGGKGKEKDEKKKDAKKAKKEIASEEEEEEEVSETEKGKSEENKNEEEEEDEDIVPVPRGRRGREKGVAALKGASKAVAGMNKGRGRSDPVQEPEVSKAKGPKRDLARAQLKGATRAMAGLAKKTAAPPPRKKSLKATSKLFMKFSNLKPKRSKKGHFKTASKLFMGLRRKFAATSLLDKKKKSAAMLKKTSKLMVGLRKSSKKPLPKEKGPSDGSRQKPSFLLIRLGGNAPKPDPLEKKGPGKLFGGLFGRKKGKAKFKPKAKLLSKVSTAANWLTRRFLSKRNRYFQNEFAIQDAWHSRMGEHRLPFPSQEELERHRENMKRFPGAHRFYGQYEDVYGHPKNFEAYRHQRFPTQRYLQNGPGRHDDASVGYYNYDDEGYGFDENGYYNEDEEFPFAHNGQFPAYAGADEEYNDYSGYPMEDDYTSYQESMEYCDEGSHLLKSQNSYFQYEVDVHNPHNVYSTYGYDGNQMSYSQDPMNPYDPRENESESFGNFEGHPPYSDMEESDYYNNYPGAMNHTDYMISPYAEPLNPYAQPMDDIIDHDDPEEMEQSHHPYYESEDQLQEHSSTLSQNRKYKLFPRPQVKLFGREKLDVPLPPSPRISFTDFDDEEEQDGEDEPLLSPQQPRNTRPLAGKSLFAKSIQRNLSQPHPRGVQKMLSTKPIGQKVNTSYYQDNYQESELQEYSPRAFGSPLGQFMKKSLFPKPILKRNEQQFQRRQLSPPPRNPFAETSFERSQSPVPSLKHAQMPSPNNDHRMGKNHSAQQLESLQKDLADEQNSTLPYHKRFGHKLADATHEEPPKQWAKPGAGREWGPRYDATGTYIGSILLSLNPYRMLNIYGTDHVLYYEGKALGETPPGESGSGKTEATKLVLRYLVAVNQRRGVTNQILEATPLLESFGNAKTVRNDNSSRFGKFVEIYLEEGVICGAITSQYLLEKSRIVFQAKNERNYHIFYEMLAGLPSQQKQAFYLQDAETYYYLNQGGNCEIPSKSDAEDFRRLLNAMESLSFNMEDQDSIFRILSSILHLGNVYFEKYETESQEVASVVSASEIRVVSELLQISHEGLQKAITYKVTETMREKIFTPLTVESAVDARDAIAKILYSLLFSWLTDRINKLVYPKQDALSIAILDIYGFEDLNFNSFEQLCINYANEYLQFFYNKIVFREEQEEYIREQIDWREISFVDNQSCIDLISQKPYGILRILDDQSGFPQATDHTFLQKCHYHHGTNELYCKPKMPLPEFGIKHFAGKVTYQVHKFLDKNYDQVRQDVLELFVSSKVKVVADLFFSHAQVLAQQKSMMGKSNTVTRKMKAQTVAAKFQQSLLELVEKMERCNPFFIRCIKPNSKKEPCLFEPDVVISQLKYSGILETIRIRKEGFPVRIPFHIFLSRYRCVMDLGRNIHADGPICVTVLRKLCPSVHPTSYCIGVSKLFMKENLYQQLESKRDQLMNKAAITLQRYGRGYLTRKRYRTLRYRIIQLQALARGYLARQKFHNWRNSMLKFRALVHMYVNRRRYLRMKAEARRLAEEERRRAEQELTKREVFNVTHLEIPAELAGLLRTATAQKNIMMEYVTPTHVPRVQAFTQLTLPLDINNYPMFKYVRVFFREPLFGMLAMTLGSSLLPVEDDLKPQAITSFKLVLRFMGDPFLNEAQEILFGNYIIQKGLSNMGLRDEILVQIANQVWRNTNPNNEERGWYLLASCLSSFAPSPNLDKYLLKYVSDYAYNGYKPICQHKLILAIQKSQQGSETARTFPPCLMEWTASRERANMALDIHCFDGAKMLCPIHSWTDGEELAGDVLRHRGVTEGWRGWSLCLKDGGQWSELAGHDYVLDLISNVELPREFPKQKSYFLTSEAAQENIETRSAVFGNKSEMDENVPPPPMMKAPSLPPQGVPESEGYYSHDSDTFSEPPSQKGMDHYLDSLFDPVLSYGNGDLEKLTAMSQKMKGGGGVGGRDGTGVPGESTLPGEASHRTEKSMYTQQQAYINQQAMILAQQMTMQAMALQQQMVSNSSVGPSVSGTPKHSFRTPSSRGNSYRVTPTVAPMPRTGEPSQRNVVNGSSYRTQTPPNRGSSFSQRPGPSNQVRQEDLAHHSALNSEHFPEPSHNIKDIINQYKLPGVTRPPPVPVRKEPPKIFGRKMDPHEEALKILKGQMSNRPLAGPSPVSNMSYVPKASRDTVALVRPVPSIRHKKPASLPPVSAVRPTTAPAASVSRELSEEQENIQTQLHRQYSEEFYTYRNVSWRIYIRKEVFYPRDSINNPLILDLIFKQIINDTLSESCIRINQEERQKMRSLLAEYRVDSVNAIADDKVKKKVVSAAREEWEVYFSRLFPAAGSVGTGVQILGVSHIGIKLLKMLKSGGNTPEQLRVLRSYSYTDIMFVTVLSKNMLEFNMTNEKLILFSSRSSQVKGLVDCFLMELKKDSNYVVAVQNYVTEGKSFLSFHKGDIIRLQPMEGLQQGWKFGAIHGRSGLFPAQCVQPVAAPDFVNLPADRKEEPRNRYSRAAASAAVAVAVASTAVAHEFDKKMDGSPTPSEYAESLDEYTEVDTTEIVLQGSSYNMVEFAKKYFREGQRMLVQEEAVKTSGESSKQGSKKSQELRDPADMVKFTKNPIQESLIEFSDSSMNRIASELFLAVMRFMGDAPMKGQSELDVVVTVLKLCGEHEVLKDEGYCQIIKQITDNSSTKTDSCQRGWRLLYILTAYHRCSEVLKPYLFKFLQDTCRSPGLHFQGIAKACEQNLRKTLQYGGRSEHPSAMELKAMVAGRSAKRQLFLLPGGIERHLKIKTCSVAFDVIEEICTEMGVHRDEAYNEYAIFAVTNRGKY
ncbi:unconventional myosin-XV [Bufo bufo]|uniref:unconventional myosin-XV n=1 Tax=Bufo bufo TaxID=8384 RepID=UPI001ABE8A30|nr:unconventional myosin-XV [Bufo bufo]